MSEDKWLEWEVSLERSVNKVHVDLYEYTEYKGDPNLYYELVERKSIRLWPWIDEYSLGRKLNKVQHKMLVRFRNRYQKWDMIELGLLPQWNGGKIILSDIETYEFISEKIKNKKKPFLKVIKDRDGESK